MFQLDISTPYFNNNHSIIGVPYVCKANPELLANLSKFEYSLDGNNWSSMTPTEDTIVNNLEFSNDGNSYTFYWKVKEDIPKIYNRDIFIRLQASSANMLTVVKNYRLYYSKQIISSMDNVPIELPEDYSGVPGHTLLEKAPKVIK